MKNRKSGKLNIQVQESLKQARAQGVFIQNEPRRWEKMSHISTPKIGLKYGDNNDKITWVLLSIDLLRRPGPNFTPNSAN